MSNTKGIITATILASALSAGICHLYTTKNGKKIRKNFANCCSEYKEKGEDFVESLCESLSGTFSGQTENITDKVKEVLAFVQEEAGHFTHFDDPEFRHGMLAGAIIGALLGTGGTMLLSNSPQKTTLMQTVCEQTAKWNNVFKNVAHTVHEIKRCTNGARPHTNSQANSIDKAIEMALCGLQVWKGMQKR